MIYSGLGSRKTPPEILSQMEGYAEALAIKGFTLRSGGADGADSAFERGAVKVGGKTEIFLPWANFNRHPGKVYALPDDAFRIAASVHPAWDRCSPGAKRLHARNTQQILGENLDTPTQFVICWTPNGDIVGGTATAIKLAQKHAIPVINLGDGRSFWPQCNSIVDAILKANTSV